jgi:4-cresol dehydrogenase (hydroxylating)
MTEATRDHASYTAAGGLPAAMFERLRAVVGEAHVLATPDDVERHSLDTSLWATRGVAVVLPGSAGEVAQVVRIAAEYRVPVWTFSKGKNWGNGAQLARESGALILLLERMNRILAVNEELAYAVVEPGVTYGQLSAHLARNRIALWADCTDSTPEGSVLGNALERGIGYTQYSDHCGALCGMEVVLASGEILRTGGGPENSRVRHTYKWGTGPYVDGLFCQSNLGIVTSAGIWLMPEPEAMTLFVCNVDREEELPEAVDVLRRLSLRGAIQPNVHVANDVLSFANLTQYPWDRLDGATRLSPALRAELRDTFLVAPWTLTGAIYGDRAVVRANEREVRKAFRRFGHVDLVGERNLAAARALLPAWRRAGRGSAIDRLLRRATRASVEKVELLQHLHEVFRGVPGEHILTFAYFRNRRYARRSDRPTADVDPARDGCGIMWGALSCPIAAGDTRELLALVKPIFERHGFDLSVALMMINPRSFIALLQFFFDRDGASERERVEALHDEILETAPRHGFPQVRTNVGGFDRVLEGAPGYARFVATLKDAVDPGHVLAPGRYGVGT